MDSEYQTFEPDLDASLLEIRSKQHDVTAELIASTITLNGSHIMSWPEGFVELFNPVRLDPQLVWPTTIRVTRILMMVDPAPGQEPPQIVWSRVTLFGTGWEPAKPLSLKWNNAWGFPGASVPLPDAVPDARGFLSMDLVHKTTPRHPEEYEASFQNQLVLVAQQKVPNGQILRHAHQRGLPAHIIWQWVP